LSCWCNVNEEDCPFRRFFVVSSNEVEGNAKDERETKILKKSEKEKGRKESSEKILVIFFVFWK